MIDRNYILAFVFTVWTLPLSAAPVVSFVQNAASNLNPVQMPNSPISPGSIFIIKGSGLGPANLTIAPAAFQTTTLSGTSVSFTVAGTTVNALMYYTSDKQLAALLPSNTPTGGGTVTVTYNGQSSPPTAIRGVVARNLGIFTLDSSGTGQAIVTYPDYSLVSGTKGTPCGGPNTACGAANPGDTLILWATGLGAIGGSDAAGAGLGQDMPNVPLAILIGGVQAPILYRGRSGCCIGEDQIVFRVPDNVPAGCAVPLVGWIMGTVQVSNSTRIPIARGSRDCVISDLPTLPTARFANASSLSFADAGIEKILNSGGAGFRDTANVELVKIGLGAGIAPFLATGLDGIPAGTCSVSDDSNPGNPDFGITGFSGLNGGASFTLRGPNGNATVPYNNGEGGTISAAGTFVAPGEFTITGAGGSEVGPFSASLTIPPLPTLTSPASAANFTLTRAAGLTVNWSGGGAGTVNIEITSAPNAAPDFQATVQCIAPASAGTLTIPNYVTVALPGGNNGRLFFSFSAPTSTFTATGIDFGTFHATLARTSFGGFTVQ